MSMITVSRILCPVDLSDCSRRALEHATVLAGYYGARLSVLGVLEAPVFVQTEGLPVLFQFAPDARPAFEKAVNVFAESARSTGVPVDVRIEEGDVTRHILEVARRDQADLVVMGTHGRSGFERLSLGSIAEKLIRRATCPVLTVPPHAAGHRAVAGAYRQIVFPTDFSEAAAHALPFALSLAQEAGGRLLLLHVVEWPSESAVRRSESYELLLKENEEAAAERLAAVVPEEARLWCQPEVMVAHGRAAKEIVRIAEARQADLLVLGVSKRGVIDAIMGGATAGEIVRAAPCPVLTVRGVAPRVARPGIDLTHTVT